MISTFGCVNSLVLSGARAYYAMAKDRLFFAQAGTLNRAKVPGWSLWVQGVWAAALVLPRTYNTATGQYGNLYGNLLDYVISAALIFYILTIAAVFRLRHKMPNVERSYRVPGYPGDARALYSGRGGGSGDPVRLSARDHVAGSGHRAGRRSGLCGGTSPLKKDR